MRARGVPVVLVAALAALAGCSDAGDDPTAAPRPVQSASPGDDGARTTASPRPVASIAGLVPGRTVEDSQGHPITVTPVTLKRQGKLALLEIAARNDDPQRRTNFAFSLRGSGTRFDEVMLVDAADGKRYLVARDSKDECLCTSFVSGVTVEPGGTAILGAYFAAPPANVTALDVSVPTAGTFTDVPIS